MRSNEEKQTAATATPPLKAAKSATDLNTRHYEQWVEIRALLHILDAAWADGEDVDASVIESTPSILHRLLREVEAIEC